MSEETKNRLYEAAISGTLDNLRAAFEACSTDEWERYGRATFQHAVKNPNPAALEMVKFLMTKGRRCSNVSGWQMKPDSYMLRYAAKNTGSCALDIMKLLMKHCCDSECRNATDSWMLRYAAGNIGPCALGMVKLVTASSVPSKET